MNQMPQMPGISKVEESVEEKSTDSVDLGVPSHELEKPEFITHETNDKSQVKLPSAPKKGIEVVALRKGFYNQMRHKEGNKFLIKGEEHFAEWFKCVDPVLEKKRQLFLKAKKAKQ